MTDKSYSEEQMMPWIQATTPPTHAGCYQLVTPGSLAIFAGWYEDDEWKIGFDGKWSAIELNPVVWKWRGLSVKPKTSKLDQESSRRRQ